VPAIKGKNKIKYIKIFFIILLIGLKVYY